MRRSITDQGRELERGEVCNREEMTGSKRRGLGSSCRRVPSKTIARIPCPLQRSIAIALSGQPRGAPQTNSHGGNPMIVLSSFEITVVISYCFVCMIAWDKKSPGKKMELEEGPMDSCSYT